MATNNAINASAQGVIYNSGTGTMSGLDGGTAGKILTSNGTGVAPSFQTAAAGSGSWSLLNSNTFSAQTSVVFNNTYFTTSYNFFYIYGSGSWDGTGSITDSLTLLLSSNNGSTWLNTGYNSVFLTAGAAGAMTTTANANNFCLTPYITAAANTKIFQFGGFIYNMNTAAVAPSCNISTQISLSTAALVGMSNCQGCRPAGTAMNALQISTANAISGTINLYGIKN